MALVGDTGNGATFTLTTQSAVSSLKVEKISISESALQMLDVSTLSTSGQMEEIATDLASNPEITLDVVWSQSATAITVSPAVDTAALTFPVGPTQTTTTAATLAGTGHVTAIKYPDLENGAAMKGQVKFKFNGDTGPTYTRGA